MLKRFLNWLLHASPGKQAEQQRSEATKKLEAIRPVPREKCTYCEEEVRAEAHTFCQRRW